MTSLSEIVTLTPEERARFGIARAQTAAFGAVYALWQRRRAEGKSQAELAAVLGKDEGWLSKNLRGPRNWTMKTLGELIEALDGDLEVFVYGNEDPLLDRTNHDAYDGYRPETLRLSDDIIFQLDRRRRELPSGSINPATVDIIVSPND